MLAEQTKKRREIRRNISVTSDKNSETEDEKDFTENLDKKTVRIWVMAITMYGGKQVCFIIRLLSLP